MTKKRALMVIAAAILVSAAALGAWAVGTDHPVFGGPSFDSPMRRMIAGKVGRFLVFRSDFELRDDQKKKIFDILKARKEEILPLAETMLDKRTQLREIIMKKPTDEQAVRAAAASLGSSIVDASILASQLVAEAKSVLTEDQWHCILEYRRENDKAVHKWLKQLGR